MAPVTPRRTGVPVNQRTLTHWITQPRSSSSTSTNQVGTTQFSSTTSTAGTSSSSISAVQAPVTSPKPSTSKGILARGAKKTITRKGKYICTVVGCPYSGDTRNALRNHRHRVHFALSQNSTSLRMKFSAKRKKGSLQSSQSFKTKEEELDDRSKFVKDLPPLKFDDRFDKPSSVYVLIGLKKKDPPSSEQLQDFLHDLQVRDPNDNLILLDDSSDEESESGSEDEDDDKIRLYIGVHQGVITGTMPKHHYGIVDGTAVTKAMKKGVTFYLVHVQVYRNDDSITNHNKAKAREAYLQMVASSQQSYMDIADRPDYKHSKGLETELINEQFPRRNVQLLLAEGKELTVKNLGEAQYQAHVKDFFCFDKRHLVPGSKVTHNRHNNFLHDIPLHPNCYFRQKGISATSVPRNPRTKKPRRPHVNKLFKLQGRPTNNILLKDWVLPTGVKGRYRCKKRCPVAEGKGHNAVKDHVIRYHGSMQDLLNLRNVMNKKISIIRGRDLASGKVFNCPVPNCPLQFKTRFNLDNHKNSIHGSGASNAYDIHVKFKCSKRTNDEPRVCSQTISSSQEQRDIAAYLPSAKSFDFEVERHGPYTLYMSIGIMEDNPPSSEEFEQWLDDNKDNQDVTLYYYPGICYGRNVEEIPHYHYDSDTTLTDAMRKGMTLYLVYREVFDTGDYATNQNYAQAKEAYLQLMGFAYEAYKDVEDYDHFSGVQYEILNLQLERGNMARLLKDGILLPEDLEDAQYHAHRRKSCPVCLVKGCAQIHQHNTWGNFKYTIPLTPNCYIRQKPLIEESGTDEANVVA